jgi:hypothetical protein
MATLIIGFYFLLKGWSFYTGLCVIMYDLVTHFYKVNIWPKLRDKYFCEKLFIYYF